MCQFEKIVKELQSELASNANEMYLVDLINRKLRNLRSINRKKGTEQQAETVAFISEMASVEVALREFIETLEDKETVRTRDDAEKIAVRFKKLSRRLKPYLVAKRAEKEFRELIEQAGTLPRAAIAKAEAEYRYRLIQLEGKAESCPKCKSRMMIRDSQYGMFWGCSTFPRCWGRRRLTNKERVFLDNDR